MRKQYKQCDRCKAEGFDTELEIYEISVNCRNTQNASNVAVFLKQDWCKECVSVTALLGMSEKEMEARRVASLAPVKPATLEDIVYEIACDAVSNNRPE